jgi:hypothetical protein
MVVQICPTPTNPAFACCFLVVTEVKPFGVVGYVQHTGDKRRKSAGLQGYTRLNWDEFEIVGAAHWVIGEGE